MVDHIYQLGTLAWFKSKAELAIAAFEHHWNEKRPLLDEIFSSQVRPLTRLENYCDYAVRDQLAKYEKVGKLCVREGKKIDFDPVILQKRSPLLDAIPLAGNPAHRVRQESAN